MSSTPEWPLLVVLCGLPGSGKSTFSSSLCNYFSSQKNIQFFLFSFDDIELALRGNQPWNSLFWHQTRTKVFEQVSQLLEQHQNEPILVVLDDNMYYRSMRHVYFKLARHYSVAFLEIFLDCPVNTCITRNQRREHQVTEETILQMSQKIQLPSPEAHSWESHHMTLHSPTSQDLQDFDWEEFYKFWNRRIPRLFVVETDQSNSSNLVHQVDLSIRKIISEIISEVNKEIPMEKRKELNLLISKSKKDYLSSISNKDIEEDFHQAVRDLTEGFHHQCLAMILRFKTQT